MEHKLIRELVTRPAYQAVGLRWEAHSHLLPVGKGKISSGRTPIFGLFI